MRTIHKPALKRKPTGDSMALYKRLTTYSKQYWPWFIVAIGANIAYSGIDALFTYLMKPLLDKGFVQHDVTFLKWLPLLIIGLFALRSLMNLLGDYTMSKIARNIVLTFRQQIFDKLLHLPCRYYDQESSGQLLSLIVYNAAQVSSACTNALTQFVQSGFLALGLLIVLFTLSWQLSLLLLITGPVVAIAVKLSSKRLRELSRKTQDSMANIAHVAEEAIEGYRVVRIFGGETYEKKKFYKAVKSSMNQELKIIVAKAAGTSSVQMVGILVLALLIYFATSKLGTGHQLTAGGFAAMIAAMLALLKPVKDLTTLNALIQRGLAGAETIFEMLDNPDERDEGQYETARVQGAIEFKQVSFAYTAAVGPVLQDISFKIHPGQVVALVGRSGSGKSTIASLLPRFYDVEQGSIAIDGINLFDYKLKNLRQQFALVSQHVSLFNDSIANNIAYGCLERDVSDEEIRAAAKAAHAMEFIDQLPEGLNTLIGENGVLLSGGQRQRLAIARALLKDAPILILDEATSALDSESERYIQAALEAVMKNRTTLVIAHRLSTIESADNIIVMDASRI
ncbi:MAG: lipid A export permease/ATP-binding protein MsbA, partial [Gammaproteobacteria bacterium]|nr:lipid A export permease/ATP-binding protein MsbA [Gammaproteobacteria bacterium]